MVCSFAHINDIAQEVYVSTPLANRLFVFLSEKNCWQQICFVSRNKKSKKGWGTHPRKPTIWSYNSQDKRLVWPNATMNIVSSTSSEATAS